MEKTASVIINVEKGETSIEKLVLKDATLVNTLNIIKEEDRITFIEKALIIGTQILQMQNTTSRVDFVKAEFESFKTTIDNEMKRLFDKDGLLVGHLEDFLGPNGELARSLDQHFGEEGTVVSKILNPTDSETPLGRFMTQLHKELDSTAEGSAFYDMKKRIDDRFNELREDLHITEAVEEAVEEESEKGTAKGRTWQQFIYESLDTIARSLEDEVEFVGDDFGPLGKVGDIIIKLNSRDTGGVAQSIVIECKDTPIKISGKSSLSKELDDAKENRSAIYAIGAVKNDCVPEAVGAFRRFEGSKIICSVCEDYPLPLEVAYKVARGELITNLQHTDARAKPTDILPRIATIRGELENIRSMKAALTGATNKIDEAKGSLKDMEDNIRDELNDLESLIKNGEDTEAEVEGDSEENEPFHAHKLGRKFNCALCEKKSGKGLSPVEIVKHLQKGHEINPDDQVIEGWAKSDEMKWAEYIEDEAES